jgi:prepilin-type N-terminal cleavage/methylation domain-containing protein
MRRGQKGFTLIELMIVVAIIGILAAIAIPNFISFKKKAIISSAVANLETLRSALSQYAADRDDGCYPEDAAVEWISGQESAIHSTLGSYGLTFPLSYAGVKWNDYSYTRDGTSCVLYTVKVTASDGETVLKALPQGVCCSDTESNPSDNCDKYAKNSPKCSQFGTGL